MGLLVIDEAFDGWRDKKNTYDYSTLIDKWWQEDIKAMVLRDRNHPSVFCWSTGNEVIERKKIEVVKTAHNLNTLCRQLVGEKEVAQGMATFTLPYQLGTLRAERLRVGDGTSGMGGEETVSLKTADEAKAIRLTADRTALKADGQDLAFITVELTDANGTVNITANNELTASVNGSATLIGFGNADIKDCDRYTDSTHKAWKGRALLVVRSTGKKGKATITLQGKGLKTARVNLSLN